MTYDDWKANEPDDGEDKFCDEMVGLIASNDRLRASRDVLLAAAQRTALVMKDRMHFGNATTNIFRICFEDLQAAIAAVEEKAP